jgi:hypothetical protein
VVRVSLTLHVRRYGRFACNNGGDFDITSMATGLRDGGGGGGGLNLRRRS